MIKNKEILNLDKNFVTFSLYIGINILIVFNN